MDLSRWRKHEFDLDHEYTGLMNFWTKNEKGKLVQLTHPFFVCKRCGKQLWLNREDMNHLPYSMSHGCPVKKGEKNGC